MRSLTGTTLSIALFLLPVLACGRKVGPSAPPPRVMQDQVDIELDDQCKIDRMKVKRIVVGDDEDIVQWKVRNKCKQDLEVILSSFKFMGVLPERGDPQTAECAAADDAPRACPIDVVAASTGDRCCVVSKKVKKHENNNDGKSKIARGVNAAAKNGDCYKYTITVRSDVGSDVFDPEFVIWR